MYDDGGGDGGGVGDCDGDHSDGDGDADHGGDYFLCRYQEPIATAKGSLCYYKVLLSPL